MHSAAPQQAVIPRESGVSSTLRLIDSIETALEYWIIRRSLSSGAHSRDPVADDDGRGVLRIHASNSHSFAFSSRDAPEFWVNVPPSEVRGRRESRVPVAPAAARGVQKARALVTTGSPEHPAFPAQWFYWLISYSPR